MIKASNLPENEKDFLKTLSKGISLIKSFDSSTPQMTLSQVAVKNGLSRASARRFLLTLQHLGYLTKENDHFRITAKILELGHQFLNNLDFIEVITPLMREVSRKLGKACSAGILEGQDIIYVARIPSQHQVLSVNLSVGSRLPAYCTSMGRVMLANLSDAELDYYFSNAKLIAHTGKTITNSESLREVLIKVRRQGYAIVDQELETSLRSVAVPIHDRIGNVVCTINVGMTVGQVEIKQVVSGYLPILLEAAKKAESALYQQF